MPRTKGLFVKEQIVAHDDRIYSGVNKCLSVTVHETSNFSPGADAQAHADLQSSGNVRQASWHITVDDTEAIRSYPDTAQCWHGGTREAAESSIAVEICVNSDGDYDQAFKNAAEVVRDLRRQHGIGRSKVYDHAHWTGKDCPSRMRAAGRWKEFLDLTEPNQKEKPVGMISPFEGRLTQNHWKSGGYRGHKGMDIAPPKPGQVGMPVYAAFAGTVRKVCTTAKNGGKTSTWAKGRTGNGILVSNPDGEGNGYNHVRPIVAVGERVQAGQLIGYNDRSGNQTAPHLHFELWADWRNPDSDYDPQLAFTKFGVKPGSVPVISVQPVGKIEPIKSKPKPKPKKDATGNDKGDNKAIQTALKKMGIYKGVIDGVNGSMQKNAVKAYQRAHGLVADGVWGPKTQAHFEQVKAVQQALRNEGYIKQGVDGYYGDQTTANVRDYQKRVGLVADGVAGPITQKKLGV